MEIGFDNEKYLKLQSEHIRDRINKFGGKLYLEFGGKIFDDFHASRVLPGFKPDSKISMLSELGGQAEALVVVNAEDIENNKKRQDLGITYDMEVLRMVDSFIARQIPVTGVVITQYRGQSSVDVFIKKTEALGLKVYRHYPIAGYPANIPLIVSDEGYGRNEYIETSRPLVVVAAPGPGSGKMAVCLSQLYHEHKRGISAGYAKFETFPVWNLPITHPVNIAYESATAELADSNMLDPFHMDEYGKAATNYNRDVEIFPVLNAILAEIYGESPYKSPTDMGVNMAGNCIIDDAVVRKAACNEIVRRYFSAMRNRKDSKVDNEVVFRMEVNMRRAGVNVDFRKVVTVVREKMKENENPIVAAELSDGTIVTGKASKLLRASAALLLNSLKILAGIDDSVLLISPDVIKSMQRLKVEYLGNKNPRLHLDEMLVALSIAANTDPMAEAAFSKIPELKGCEAHSSVIVAAEDERMYKKLGVNLTCEPEYLSKCLFHDSV